jgi:tetratricopeptide (TPR) repeat protein
MEQLIQQASRTPEDELFLANLYEAAGETPKAGRLYLARADADQNDANLLAQDIRGLILAGSPMAQEQLKRLGTLEPDSLRTVELQARLLHAQKQDKQVAALLIDFANKHPTANLVAVAGVLENLHLDEAAEQLYRRNATQSKTPQGALAYAAFLARQRKLSAALDVFERVWRQNPTEALATTAVSLVRAAGLPESNECKRVEKWLKEASDRKPESITLQLSLADLQAFLGELQDAERNYRKCYARQPQDPNCLNNLAWLLTLTQSNLTEALDLIQSAIKLTGPVSAVLDTRAVVYLSTNQADLAVHDLELAVDQSPNATRYFHLAEAYRKAGKLDAATAALRKAEQLGLEPGSLYPRDRVLYPELKAELGAVQ